ncbi:MAG: hypothetical protein ACXVQY_04625 [Actinomycetota bacterium]
MAQTYGEQMLARAEARARNRSVRRRRVRLLVPFLVATIWAMLDLVAARNARLSGGGAGGLRLLVDYVIVIGWTIAFVIGPMVGALKRDPLPSGAALAVLSGPILSPILFGSGGWTWWQSLVVIAIACVVLLSVRARRRSTNA